MINTPFYGPVLQSSVYVVLEVDVKLKCLFLTELKRYDLSYYDLF